MALTATRTSNGLELFMPPNPGQKLSKWFIENGQAASIGCGIYLALSLINTIAAAGANLIGVSTEEKTGNTSGLTLSFVDICNKPIFVCTFTGHEDVAATTGGTTTIASTNLSASTNDYYNGALLYIYEGPGKGDTRVVTDFVGSGQVLTLNQGTSQTTTTATKFIIIPGPRDGANKGIGPGSPIDFSDKDTLNAADNTGPLVVYPLDPLLMGQLLKDLMLPVVINDTLYNSP